MKVPPIEQGLDEAHGKQRYRKAMSVYLEARTIFLLPRLRQSADWARASIAASNAHR